jgi:hypothetical protein
LLPRDQNAEILDRAGLEREVDRVIAAADAAGATVRVLGSIGVALHCPDAKALLPAFERAYADIDFAAYGSQARELAAAITGLGYREDREVSITSEGRRAIFDHPTVPRIHLDVFFDELEFCHRIPLAGRLHADRPTIPLAELLLSKLQIVKINRKDVLDALILLAEHPLGQDDGEVDSSKGLAAISVPRILSFTSADWGWWRTVTGNLAVLERYLDTDFTDADMDVGGARPVLFDPRVQVEALKKAIDEAPKSTRWKLRARVGERQQWYQEPEEVAH